jgi:hypothetical protein
VVSIAVDSGHTEDFALADFRGWDDVLSCTWRVRIHRRRHKKMIRTLVLASRLTRELNMLVIPTWCDLSRWRHDHCNRVVLAVWRLFCTSSIVTLVFVQLASA